MEISKIEIRERGATPRGLGRAFRAAAKEAYKAAIEHFHQEMRPLRFTAAHGKEAQYRLRKGEELPYGSKAFWRSYTGRKVRKFGHKRPLEFTGFTKRQSRMVTITSTSNQGKGRYNVRVLNFHPDLAAEFRRILPREAKQMGRVFDARLDKRLDADRVTTTKVV